MSEGYSGLRDQVIAQCRVVEHLAKALADLHADLARAYAEPGAAVILDIAGERTAHIMEALGNILNGMDAVEDSDEWTAPIFAEAQKRWPVSP